MNITAHELIQEIARDHFVTVCAWCGATLIVEAGHGLSHGICDQCAEALSPKKLA